MIQCKGTSVSQHLDAKARFSINFALNKSVTEVFRDRLLTIYPGLKKKVTYRSLAAYLLFTEFRDVDTGHPVACWSTLGHIEQRDEQIRQRSYRGTRFLEEFQSEVMSTVTFNWSNHEFAKGKARVLTAKWEQEIIEALRIEHQHHHHKIKRVNIVTGRDVNARKLSRWYKQKRNETVQAIPLDHPGRRVIQYLSARSETGYTRKVNDNIEAARDMINNLPPAPRIGLQLRDIQHNVLSQIVECPKPTFATSCRGRTDRIFEVPAGYMGLKRQVKETLLSGWRDYDLKSSQLAICAYQWQVPEAIKFIEEDGCIWSSMLQYLGIDPELKYIDKQLYDSVKDPLKRLLYQSIFGMSEQGLRFKLLVEADILWRIMNGRKPTDLLGHPVIASLIEARERQMAEISKRGYAETCFGRVIQVTEDEHDLRSALAQQAQAIELDMLLPIIDVAESSNDELQILLWCHDGFIANLRQSKRVELWESRMRDAVKKRARQHGIVTALEVEQL